MRSPAWVESLVWIGLAACAWSPSRTSPVSRLVARRQKTPQIGAPTPIATSPISSVLSGDMPPPTDGLSASIAATTTVATPNVRAPNPSPAMR